ncbi:MAG: DUF1802 family protein [Pedosphaera sp.]|nr:DUF1802 family protein [Pedosphaera sp.]MSU42580.1 DUF1802 family protein [Pedosphaera sp.]
MTIAFKEWAVVVDALGRGEQIVILRKGGIAEGRGGFQVEHERFWFFPTLFHQQRESVLPTAQSRYDAIAPHFPSADTVRLEYFAEVTEARQVDSLAAAERLRGQHIWRDEVIAQRFDWGRDKAIHALTVRVRRLPQPVSLPMLPEYGGCKSWVTLAQELDTNAATPVLGQSAFESKLAAVREALGTELAR